MLLPRRSNSVRGLASPPFYVLEVQPAVTFAFVGLLIDPNSRVLAGARRSIPALLAAGADAGGLYVRGYAGSLAVGLVFDRQVHARVRIPQRHTRHRTGERQIRVRDLVTALGIGLDDLGSVGSRIGSHGGLLLT